MHFTASIGSLRCNEADGNANVKIKYNSSRFDEQKNNFALASLFLVNFFAVIAVIGGGNFG